MQGNNNNDNNNKSAKESGDEIIEILDNYRKKQENKEIPAEKQKEIINLEKKPDDEINISSKAVISHFSDDEQENRNDPNPLDSHFSDAYDKKEIQKAKAKDERFKKEKKPGKKFVLALGHSSVFFKAVFYIFFVLVISAYLSYFIIAVGNDVFALVKDDKNIELVVDENATVDKIAEQLEEHGIINNPWAFKLFLKYRSDEGYEFIPGNHELSAKMNYTQLIQILTTVYTERVPVRVMIPEGFTVDQIIELLVENGVGTREGYVEAINNYSYKHEFVKELETLGYSESRKYRLEGYLYPDTYDFYTDTEEYLVINKFLNNFSQKFWSDYKSQYQEICKNYNMTFDDLIILASMVQAEGNNALDFEYISQVFHNRLDNPNSFPKLESDATIQYVLPVREEDLTQNSLKFDSPYNTYVYQGLPPGAICNPGFDAISAALYPSTPENENGKKISPAYFFVSNKAGKTYYATTDSQHNNNKKKVAKDNAAIAAGTYNG